MSFRTKCLVGVVTVSLAVVALPGATAGAATINPLTRTAATREATKQFASMRDGEVLHLSGGIDVTKRSGQFVVTSPAELERSVCGATIAAVLFGMGSVALFAMAALLGPGEVAVIAGVEMTAEQLGYAAGASGSFAALEAWADSKFCS